MYSDPILEEKWRVQKQMAKEANYDLKKLMENSKKTVEKLFKEKDWVLKYSKRKGGYIK